MCGRFVLDKTWEEIEEYYNFINHKETFHNFTPSYNIVPSNLLPIILKNPLSQSYEVKMMKWGFIPGWCIESKTNYTTINARIETLEQKPFFKKTFKTQRCLIPASGFYEWDKRVEPKQPVYIYSKQKPIFSFGGLWEQATNQETGEITYSFTIVTIPANKIVQEVHDRMPLIISHSDYGLWLKNEEIKLEEKQAILEVASSIGLKMHNVSRAVNNPRNNGKNLIEAS